MQDERGHSAGRLDRWAEREAEIAQSLANLRSLNPRARADAARRLGELGAPCAPALLAAVDDPNPYVRSAAAEALGRVEIGAAETEVIDCLLAAIDDRNSYVVVAAIRSLGWLRAEESRQQIVGCLDDPNPYVVAAAIQALGRLGPPSPAERLAAFLDSTNPHLQAAAAKAVGSLGYKPAVPALMRNLEESLSRGPGRSNTVPVSYIQALAELEAREAIPLLLNIARHHPGLRSRATMALMHLQAQEAVPVLAYMLADPSNKLRINLVRMMVRFGYKAALPVVRSLLTDIRAQVRLVALNAVTEWQDPASLERVRHLAFHDPSPMVRSQAVHSLAVLAGAQAVPDLVSLLGELNTDVRFAAVTELGRMESLPAKAVAALQQLAAVEQAPKVAEAARDVLARIDSLPVAFQPAAPLPPAPPVPDALQPEAATLLAALVRWQEALPTLLGKSDLAEMARIDAALTTLIVTLRRE